jgi:hypothetical protein
VFTIKIDRLVKAPTTSGMFLMKGTSKGTFNLQANSIKSNPPMTGKWKIRCSYPDGKVAETEPLKMDSSSHTIQRHISEHCPFMRNRILVHGYDSPFSHWNVGKQFYIDF